MLYMLSFDLMPHILPTMEVLSAVCLKLKQSDMHAVLL